MIQRSWERESVLPNAELDESALTELYNAYFPRIYNYVHYRVNDFYDADDIVSQIFLKAFAKLKFYKPEIATFSVWIFAIARHTVIDHVRHNARRQIVSLDLTDLADEFSPHPADMVAGNETKECIRHALTLLSQREREIIALKFWSGCTNRTIARIVGLSESNTGVILYRAMRRLRAILEHQGMTNNG